MDAATYVALAALVISVIYHHLNRRDMMTTFQSKLEGWTVEMDRRINLLESDFRQSQIGVLHARVSQAEQFIDELREMKHMKVDPYIPRAVDDHERRITRLETQ